MDTAVKTRATNKPAANERQDLRAWIAKLRAAGELQDIAGAGREKGDRRHRLHLSAPHW